MVSSKWLKAVEPEKPAETPNVSMRDVRRVQQEKAARSTVEVSAMAETSIAETSTVEEFQAPAAQTSTVEIPAIADSAIVTSEFLRIPNGVFDRVLPTLLPSDQVVLLRLYRLSRGFGKEECTVGYETIGKACNLSARQASVCVERLILAGWIERVGVQQGGKSRHGRGSVYRVNLPAVSTKAKSAMAESTIAATSSNKDKDINERIKRGAGALDSSKCPDCEGKGFWWPEGYERGVAKCKHPKLRGT
jgi:hypothetical protein